MRNTMEPFTVLDKHGRDKAFHLYDEMLRLEGGVSSDHDLQYVKALREQYPDMIVTAAPQVNANVVAYAAAGLAELELDTESDSYASWKGYVRPAIRANHGSLGEYAQFAKYHLKWLNEDFVMYVVQIGFSAAQYILKERKPDEKTYGPSKITDDLIFAVGEWQSNDNQVVWVFDGYWKQDRELYKQVKKASWDKVILDEHQKKDLTEVATTFFESKKIYEDFGVPWKRGLLFYGPPGNGKTISTKALMHTLLFERGEDSIPTLYVKSISYLYHIGQVFAQARALAPCMLVLEDVESIVNSTTRSYFFNEMDGLNNNDGIFVVATTNYLERLDPGLTKRPSRFDRKYLFPLPNDHERQLYCEFWRTKLIKHGNVDFPEKLCPAMARITPAFSFAFLQECFVATMLSIAHKHKHKSEDVDVSKLIAELAGPDDLDKYELWRVFKKEADLLRKQIDDEELLRMTHATNPASMLHEAIAAIPSQLPAAGDGMQHSSSMSQAGAMSRVEVQNDYARGYLPFNFHKQPELNAMVYNWVGPRQ